MKIALPRPGNGGRLPARLMAAPGASPLEAAETLRAIRSGEVDAVLLAGKDGSQVFTLRGAEHAYRVLIESMNEGALTLTAGKMILYANACFARMVKCPLQQVIGGSFRQFLSPGDRAALRSLLRRSRGSGAKIQLQLKVGDGSGLAAQISIHPLARNGHGRGTLSMVVTDMTEARRSEEMQRALAQRVIQVQEAERAHLALELHDNITQPLCAAVFRSQALVDSIPDRRGWMKKETRKLRELLGRTADEVERIARHLRPGTLAQLGLLGVLRDTTKKFAAQTGVAVRLIGVDLTMRLPPGTELALLRIVQESLENVRQHARARHVTVTLRERTTDVELCIKDDGIGFNATPRRGRPTGDQGLGLLGMLERASSVGASFEVTSRRRAGTRITLRIPVGAEPAVKE